MTRFSVLDLAPVPLGSKATDALANTLELARLAERIGYHRFWVAEHHGSPNFASTAPEILIGRIACETQRIRVGSGAVLLPFYSALKVAETFQTLEALHPGRIDLGIGRGQGANPTTAFALRSGAQAKTTSETEDQVLELLGLLSASFPEDHPYHSIHVSPTPANLPELWLLGTSEASASLAADLGLHYGFATFPRHESAVRSLRRYRREFAYQRWSQHPQSLIAVGAICASTAAEAMAIASEHDELPGQDVTPDWPNYIVGDAASVKHQLVDIAERTYVDEVMILTVVHSHAARLRSYELLAEALQLSPSP